MSPVIKNWDYNNWLSSKKYIKSFNNFLCKEAKLDQNSKILDIGCGRGKILGNLSSRLILKNKPVGIDITNHKDKDRRMNFKKKDAIIYLKNCKDKFDLILIKQTIHLFKFIEIKKLLKLAKKNLNNNGKIFILNLETYKNEIPTFHLMKQNLSKSLKRDKKIIQYITKYQANIVKKKFYFNVKISKKKYLKMIKQKYISILLNLSPKEITQGIVEIDKKFKNQIFFKDRLKCLIINKKSK